MRLTSDSVLDGLPAGTSGVMDDYRRIVRRRLLLILLLALLIVASLLLDFMLGPSGLPLQSLWQTLTDPGQRRSGHARHRLGYPSALCGDGDYRRSGAGTGRRRNADHPQ